jgi:hypothetical protein
VHKKLVNIIKFVRSGAELVQEMGSLWFYRFFYIGLYQGIFSLCVGSQDDTEGFIFVQ